MIEGIVICVLFLAGLIFLYWMFGSTPTVKLVAVGNLPPVSLKVPMPPVKAPRQEAERYERRRPAASTKYGVPYGGGHASVDTDDFSPGEGALMGVVAAAAAIVVAESIYESAIDTSPSYEYTSPTPSSYCEPSSSSWGGDSSSSSSYDSGSSSSSYSSCD